MNIKADNTKEKTLATNRRANHDFFILEKIECGIVLKGTEVKSLRLGKANFQDSYAIIQSGEVWVLNLHISHFENGNINNHDVLRERKLLLNNKEIFKLRKKNDESGITLIPLRIYLLNNRIKVELGICRGKKFYDKRESIEKREVERKIRKFF